MAMKKRKYRFQDRPPGCVTPSEAGALFGVTSLAIRYRIRTGKLKAMRTATGYFWVRLTDLEALTFRRRNRQSMKEPLRRKPRFNRTEARKFGFKIEKARATKKP